MTDNLNQLQVLNIKQTVERATACGINISEYTLRRAIRTNLPHPLGWIPALGKL